MNGDDDTNGKDGASGAPRCPDCSGPLTAVAYEQYPEWKFECTHCLRLFSDAPPAPAPAPHDRDVTIAEQIALLEAKHGAVLVDLAEWALTALRNEALLRNDLRHIRTRAAVEASDIDLRLGER